MALSAIVRNGLEGRIYYCLKEDAGDPYVSINSSTGLASEVGTPTWVELGYDTNFNIKETYGINPVYNKHTIAHYKQGREEQPTFSFAQLYLNKIDSALKLKTANNFYLKMEIDTDGDGVAIETLYLTDCNLTSSGLDKPETDNMSVSIEGVYKSFGSTPIS